MKTREEYERLSFPQRLTFLRAMLARRCYELREFLAGIPALTSEEREKVRILLEEIEMLGSSGKENFGVRSPEARSALKDRSLNCSTLDDLSNASTVVFSPSQRDDSIDCSTDCADFYATVSVGVPAMPYGATPSPSLAAEANKRRQKAAAANGKKGVQAEPGPCVQATATAISHEGQMAALCDLGRELGIVSQSQPQIADTEKCDSLSLSATVDDDSVSVTMTDDAVETPELVESSAVQEDPTTGLITDGHEGVGSEQQQKEESQIPAQSTGSKRRAQRQKQQPSQKRQAGTETENAEEVKQCSESSSLEPSPVIDTDDFATMQAESSSINSGLPPPPTASPQQLVVNLGAELIPAPDPRERLSLWTPLVQQLAPVMHPEGGALAASVTIRFLCCLEPQPCTEELTSGRSLLTRVTLIWAMCAALQPPPRDDDKALKTGESAPREAGKRKRQVAFEATAGTCASPPNDRRPESFQRTIVEARRLQLAAELAETLMKLHMVETTEEEGKFSASLFLSALWNAAASLFQDADSDSKNAARLTHALHEELFFVYSTLGQQEQGSNAESPSMPPTHGPRRTSALRFRLSWMLSSIVRYSLRWLLDGPPPFISAPAEPGGAYIEIPGVRSEVYAKLRVVPEAPEQYEQQQGGGGYSSDGTSASDGSGKSAPTTPQLQLRAKAAPASAGSGFPSSSVASKPKPAIVDHSSVLTADIPLSALVTYALRQIELEGRFLRSVSGRNEDERRTESRDSEQLSVAWATWEVVLDGPALKSSLLLEVEALQVSL